MKRKLSTLHFVLLVAALLSAGWGVTEANKAVPITSLLPKTSQPSQTDTTLKKAHAALVPIIETRLSPNNALSLIVEPDAAMTPLISSIDNARTSVAMTMYSFNDPLIEAALIRAHDRGLSVRVILNAGWKAAPSTKNVATRTYLLAHGIEVHYSPSYFALSHQKTLITDNTSAIIMTFNTDKTYYKNDRDFGVIDTDPSDVAAIAGAFDSDWNSTKQTASEGTDLVWSPGSEAPLVSLINSAQQSVYVYNEEMDEVAIEDALSNAARRGVDVEVVMTNSSSWLRAFRLLSDAGVHIRTYVSTAKAPIYIHAKMIMVDQKLAFLGSENFSHNSLEANRELGILISKPDILQALYTTFQNDWAGATSFQNK